MAKRESPDFLESRILGTIYGNCIGDAIGLLTEFMGKKEAEKYYGKHLKEDGLEYEHKVPDFHRSRWQNGDWTDDSDQMLLIIDSLHEKNGIDPVDFGQKLIGWARHGFPELGDFGGMGIGATTHYVLHHKLFGSDPHHAAKDIWEKSDCQAAPNGAVMRTSVLGIYQFHDIKMVVENCLQLCKVTHADPRCQASCVAVCCAIAFMLQQKHFVKGKFDIGKLIDDCFEQAKQVFPKDKKKQIQELKDYMYVTNLKKLKLDEHDKIGYTYKCLGAGLWALRQKNFREALTSITMEGGDADTNGAVAGALLGCKLGITELPQSWLENLYHRQWLDNKIYRFLEKFVPELSSITLVQYRELKKDNDAAGLQEKEEIQKQSKSKEKPSNETETPVPVSAGIQVPDDIPFADDDNEEDKEVQKQEAFDADKDDQGEASTSSAEGEERPAKVDDVNKMSWDNEDDKQNNSTTEIAAVHDTTM